jgi:hypothetical protein
MNKRRRVYGMVLVFASLSLFLTGCSSSRNISKSYPFNNYIAKTVELQRPAVVVNRVNGWFTTAGVISVRHARYGLVNGPTDGQCHGYYGPTLAILPAGHKIRIDCVRFEVMALGDRDQITAYGHTTIPPGTNEVSFAAPWGGAGLGKLWRAPWEADGTADREYHLGFSSFTVATNNPSQENSPP